MTSPRKGSVAPSNHETDLTTPFRLLSNLM